MGERRDDIRKEVKRLYALGLSAERVAVELEYKLDTLARLMYRGGDIAYARWLWKASQKERRKV